MRPRRGGAGDVLPSGAAPSRLSSRLRGTRPARGGRSGPCTERRDAVDCQPLEPGSRFIVTQPSPTAALAPRPDAGPVRLGVVIPLANEEAVVERLLDRVTAQLGGSDRVFCVVDRASRDRTLEVVRAYAGRDGRVVPVWAPENRSVVDAYFRGYREAYDAGSRWILEMDGGFSHEPEQIPEFVRAMERGFEYAGGSRFVRGGAHAGSFARRLVSWGGTLLANALLGTRMRDMTSGFECFSRDALARVLAQGVKSRAHFFQTEIRYLMHDVRWTEIPIRYANASPSVGTASLRDAFSSLWRLRRDHGRLRRGAPRG